MRTVAIALVFALHTGFFNLGWIGVNLFFVLSGLLITGILRTGREGASFWAPFYIKRATRILPPLILVVIAAAIFCDIEWQKIGIFEVFFLANVVPVFFPQADRALGVLWSLSVEEQFYLFWPLAIRFLDRRRIIQMLVVVLAVEPILRAAVTPFVSSYHPIFYLTPFQLDGLAAGSLLALLLEDEGHTAQLKNWSGQTTLISLVLLAGLSFVPFLTEK